LGERVDGMRVLGLFLSAFALVGLIVHQSFGLRFLDNAIIEYDKPVRVRGKEMDTLGGGGIRIRWEDQTYALVNVVPPSLKIGCGGIDINLGSLGLLNFDQFGKLFEALMGPAGVMFAAQLALSALCPQCAQTLQQLMNLANQLNQMQISKCGAVQLAGALGELAGRWINENLLRGGQQSWAVEYQNLTARRENFIDRMQRQLSRVCPNGKCGLGLMLRGGCIVEEAAKEVNVARFLGLSDRQLAAVVRGFVGDVCFPGERSIRDAFSGVPQETITPPEYMVGTPEDFIKFIAGISGTRVGNQITGLSCEGGRVSGEFPFFVEIERVDGGVRRTEYAFRLYDVVINDTICSRSKQLVDNLVNAIKNRQPLSEEEKLLLSSMPVGMFKLINYGSVYTGFLDSIKDDLAYYIAEEAAIGLIQKINQKVAEWVIAYQTGLSQNEGGQETPALRDAKKLLENISKVQKELADYRRYTIEQLRQKIQSYQVANQIYNDMLAQMSKSPIYGNMVFSRLIGLGPVGSR
jgi:hypothetical protein